MDGEPEDYSRRHFFSFGQHFPKFLRKMFFMISLDIIGLENLLLFFHEILIQNNALVLHLNCTALSQSESVHFFHVYH